MLYFSILYGVKKYDKHIVNTLNKKLYEIRKDDKE
jgi:hypothetical protein